MDDDIQDPIAVGFAEDENTGWLFRRGLTAALARPIPYLATWSILLVMAAALALPWQGWFENAADHRYQASELIETLSTTFRYDHRTAVSQLDSQTAELGSVLALLAVFVGIFSAGGWLTVFLERGEGRSLKRFLRGGTEHFWRFLRLWLMLMVLTGLWHWVFYGMPWKRLVLEGWLRVPKHDLGRLDTLDSEWHVAALGWARDGAFALLFVSTLAVGVYARARMAFFERHSAFKALFGALGSVLRRPIRTLRPLIAIFMVEGLLISLGAGYLVRWISGGLADGDTWTRLAGLFVVGQLAVLWREMSRGARYFVALEVLRSTNRTEEASWPSLGGPRRASVPVGTRR